MLPYNEGSVFLIPLRHGGYARGVVARAGKEGKVVFGYFFGPAIFSKEIVPFDDLSPANALTRMMFGDLGLINGEWVIVGKLPSWNRVQWPMPDFVRRDPLGRRRPTLVRYSDIDPMRIEAEYSIDDDSGLEPNLTSGCGAVEIKLTKLLAPASAKVAPPESPPPSPSKVDGPRSIWHYFYFPEASAAADVARSLREQGFDVEERLGADDVNWLVLAKTQAVPEETTIDAMSSYFERIARETGGKYDGWLIEVAPPRGSM
jgi:hypothetical protein